jgi:putative FmdB family regulatory protein
MPVYAFTCAGCGGFDLMRPMAKAAEPASCPTCGAQARRLFTPPGLRRLARPARRALDAEEKSAHEPDVVTEKTGRPRPHRHGPTPPWVLSH